MLLNPVSSQYARGKLSIAWNLQVHPTIFKQLKTFKKWNPPAYMWSDPISSGPTDIWPPNMSHARQTETPDIYEFTGFPQQVSLCIDWEV